MISLIKKSQQTPQNFQFRFGQRTFLSQIFKSIIISEIGVEEGRTDDVHEADQCSRLGDERFEHHEVYPVDVGISSATN